MEYNHRTERQKGKEAHEIDIVFTIFECRRLFCIHFFLYETFFLFVLLGCNGVTHIESVLTIFLVSK